MKKIKLTQGKWAIVDDDMFEYLNQWKWHVHKPGITKGFYAKRTTHNPKNKKIGTIFMARQIMRAKKGQIVDHKSGNTLDNRKENLRFCSHGQNRANSKNQKNSCGFKGIHKRGKSFMVRIQFNKKRTTIGTWYTLKEALKARNAAAKKYHGDFANFHSHK